MPENISNDCFEDGDRSGSVICLSIVTAKSSMTKKPFGSPWAEYYLNWNEIISSSRGVQKSVHRIGV